MRNIFSWMDVFISAPEISPLRDLAYFGRLNWAEGKDIFEDSQGYDKAHVAISFELVNPTL